MNKFIKISILLSALLLAGCRGGRGGSSATPTTVDPTLTPTSITTTGQSTTASSTPTTQPTNTNTFTTSIQGISKESSVATTGSDFQSRFGDGISIINNEGEGTKASEFITYFNFFSGDSLLYKISGINVTSNTDQDKTIEERDHLKIGSKTAGQSGELKMEFNYEVTKIEISASAYYKAYKDWSTQEMTATVDTTASISIDGESTSLAASEGVAPEAKVITKSYASPTKIITITTPEVDENDVGKRAFVNYIKITYIA